MKTYIKEIIILANGEEYQMKYDARVHVTNLASVPIDVLHKENESENWGIIEKALEAGHKKGSDSLVGKGRIKPSGGSIELVVWY